jgi:ribosomal protein S17
MAVDYHNKEIKKGDIVRCIARHYTTKYPARLYEVLQAGEGDLITLENSFLQLVLLTITRTILSYTRKLQK